MHDHVRSKWGLDGPGPAPICTRSTGLVNRETGAGTTGARGCQSLGAAVGCRDFFKGARERAPDRHKGPPCKASNPSSR
ncbi:hypothetical protein Lokhon_01696 [Limimaricola hongkongensis DSM 17492]|uniref:Uncharacterized protein n=1 Tax=Limimaricola hongkongensis DSM 17492 TaxID=1122180 RepID=A0A017HCX9_9RHOB|nr:hypothetical protein Lokhon_01696 [Limimaricola hongkongensis DSM 17492]